MDLLRLSLPVRRHPMLGYAIAIVLSVAAIWVRFAIGPVFVGYPFITGMVAITITGYLGGVRAGVVAAILTGLLSRYYLIDPVGTLAMTSLPNWIGMGFYVLLVGTILTLMHAMYVSYDARLVSEDALRALNRDLESRVIARTAALEAEMAERASAEAKVRQMQKMETVGQLTGGIAHDFNNMLAIVIGSLDIARRRLSGDEHPKVAQGIDNASEGARRAATLTARLLAFSRQQPLEPQSLDANTLVSGMSELLRRTIGENIRVETVLAGGLWRAFADAAQLENAIVNLAVNARDAMPDGGKLTIETANCDLDDRYARTHDEVEPGQYVLVCVSDSGTGMPPEVIARAFDPFYTTKGVGKGTGLGLSQVYGYVKQSGGHVKIYSEIGRGTTIKIYIPRHLGSERPAEERAAAIERLPGGHPDTIVLVVEDEHAVRHMTVDALRELGYTVIQASDGNQALEQIAVQPRIDLLLTDIVMPGITGRQLADQVAALRPEIRILFTTGYTRNAVVHNGMLDTDVALLSKPFSIEQLAHKIEDVLRGRGSNRVG